MRSINLIATVAATASLGLAAAAQADTYCVGSPGNCPADASGKASIESAVDAASAHPGHDKVLLGAGEFVAQDDSFMIESFNEDDTIGIVGQGTSTVLRSS